MPFEEEQKRLVDKIQKEVPRGVYGDDFIVSDGGIIIRR